MSEYDTQTREWELNLRTHLPNTMYSFSLTQTTNVTCQSQPDTENEIVPDCQELMIWNE